MSMFKKILFFLILIIIPSISGFFYGLAGVFIGILTSLLVFIFLIIINADKFILFLYKAHLVEPGELSEIQDIILELSSRYGVSAPSVYITDIELPGSFIIGRNVKNTSIIIPKRMSTLLKNEEIKAIIAHNIVQIDRTIRKRSIVALIAGVLTMSSSAIRWVAVFTGFGDYNDPAPKLFGLFIIGLVGPPAAALIHSLPKEDYDEKAVALLDNPEALILAINDLESKNVMAYPSIGFLCLIDPQKENFFEHLFDFHPVSEVRVNNLRTKGEKHD